MPRALMAAAITVNSSVNAKMASNCQLNALKIASRSVRGFWIMA